MTESPVLGKVREQFADLEQSSLRNDYFLGARSLFKFRVFEENSPFVASLRANSFATHSKVS